MIGTILYNIIIRPLELFFQFVYGAAYDFIGNYGLSIIMLSLAINFLVLPLYRRADAIQNEERDLQKKMSRWVMHIKKTFSGDERYMKLSTYYRQNNYSSIYALRSSISLFLQIPFFIAAYRFLSHYDAIRGVSFGPIADLGAPDAMLHIFGQTLNLLPILMTVINFVSSTVYTRGFPLKSKIQLYAIAVFFLVFLYRSPAGLVFYWTLNNLFSLVKNVFYKLKHPRAVLCVMGALVGTGLWIVECTGAAGHTTGQKAFVLILGTALALPLLIAVIRAVVRKMSSHQADTDAPRTAAVSGDKPLFLLSCLALTVLVGFLIPSALIESSAQEFVEGVDPSNPLGLLVQPLLVSFGLFVMWFGVFYSLAQKRAQQKMALGAFILLAAGVVNYMFFGRGLGTISADLVFDDDPSFSVRQWVINILILLAVGVIAWLIWKKKRTALRVAAAAVLIGLISLSGMNIVRINASYKDMLAVLNTGDSDEVPTIPLSKNGKNVMVIMLDRAISGYIPFIVKENPILKEQFAGFTYYPNTISYGKHTNFGAPALFGGYEYTPAQINARKDQTLAEKHNEALKVLPRLFSEEGYRVTVGDPPYAGYQWIPDLSIYDDLENTHAYRLSGFFDDESDIEKTVARRKRNLFCYGIFKTSPVILQKYLYDDGQYFATSEKIRRKEDKKEEETEEEHLSSLFTKTYSVLEHLTDMTKIRDDDENTLLVLQNSTTHSPIKLQKPEYEQAARVDNSTYNEEHADDYEIDGQRLHLDQDNQEQHYDVNMAALMRLGDWFDELRRQGVYDNTRIIVVSDHGYGLNQIDNLWIDSVQLDAMWFNPLFMVKDFGKHEFRTSDEFMTNADVPGLAAQGLIRDAANPYTGRKFDPSAKKGKQPVVMSGKWKANKKKGKKKKFDTSDGKWFTVHDNIFDPKNWKQIKEP